MTGLNLGIDIGTQGVRALCVADDGEVVARASVSLDVPAPEGPQEQDPEAWWSALVETVVALGPERREIGRVALACTSGTLCLLDSRGAPIVPAVLYSDGRGAGLSRYGASWGAGSLTWFAVREPATLASADLCTSAGGYLAGRLAGHRVPIDHSQALKLGYDLHADCWHTDLAVGPDRLPDVVCTDAPVATIDRSVASLLGLRPDAAILAGATDGVAAQLACAASLERWTSVVGSTLVWKGVSDHPIDAGGVYSHRGPGHTWLPGAAANAGGRIVSEWFAEADLDALDAALDDEPPSILVYPSVVTGERFPFADPGFVPFADDHDDPAVRYSACVTGVACVERWGHEVLSDLVGRKPTTLATAGGATRAEGWLQRRADVLQTPLVVPTEPSSAFGAAVVAAADAHGGLTAASRAMVRVADKICPRPEHSDSWARYYEAFKTRCRHGSETG